MLLLNFSHPITDAQRAQIEALTGRAIERVIQRMPQFHDSQPLGGQVRALVDGVGLTSQEWQSAALLINPPGLVPAALALLAELHGRTGYFPATVRIRPVADVIPRQFEVAEILDLQAIRDSARRFR
ncbi:MAG: hypothetical protein HY328_18150 [Chloroflexi bacterium]|nr:hypothetical protein [Chloroflexota bacterium]